MDGLGRPGAVCLVHLGCDADRRAQPGARGDAAARADIGHLRAGLAAYAMFGLGYIGYMTFVIAWMRDHGASTGEVIAMWTTFGVASLLGPWLWHIPLTRWIPGRMLAAALALLGLGALLPLVSAAIVSMLISATLFGASMWNIPGSITHLVKRALPKPAWGAALATFTIYFAIGQILGPVATGWLADTFGGLLTGLALSVGVLMLGALIALAQRDYVYQEPVARAG